MVATWRKLLWLLLLTTKTTAHLLDLMVDLEPACSRQTFFWTGPGGAFSIRYLIDSASSWYCHNRPRKKYDFFCLILLQTRE